MKKDPPIFQPQLENKPIGVFDSGLGGLTVLSALREQLPNEHFLYFADTRYLPYGDRSEDFLRQRGQVIVQTLADRGAKAIVIACNTATAAAAEAIRETCRLPIIALEPAVKPAAAQSKKGIVGVLATTRTLESQRYERLLQGHASHIQVVSQACPDLADAIEAEGPGSQRVGALLDRYISPLSQAGVDVVVLGCTHYPWVKKQISARLPIGVSLVDTGEAVARQLVRVLSQSGLLASAEACSGKIIIGTSGNRLAILSAMNKLGERADAVEEWSC